MQKRYFWNPATCNCKNGQYLASIVGNSVITCDEITEEMKAISKTSVPTKIVPTETFPIYFNKKKESL